jgi:IclR family pca regulon transcriptional regulator
MNEAVPMETLLPNGSKDFVASLQKGLQGLTCFGRGTAKPTLSEVARSTGSSSASARRSSHALVTLNYLESEGKRFWMAPRALLVAHAYLSSRPTPQLAQPLLDAPSKRTRESASLGRLLDDDAIIIARSTAQEPVHGIWNRLSVARLLLGNRWGSTRQPASRRRGPPGERDAQGTADSANRLESRRSSGVGASVSSTGLGGKRW